LVFARQQKVQDCLEFSATSATPAAQRHRYCHFQVVFLILATSAVWFPARRCAMLAATGCE
jgi:hypothetical protein